MRIAIMVSFIVLLSTGFAAHAGGTARCTFVGVSDKNTAILKNCPGDVEAYLDTELACQHWQDEDGYNAERTAEIKEALSKLRCDSQKQWLWILESKEYHKRKDVIKTLHALEPQE